MNECIAPLTERLLDEFIDTVNAHIDGWPYSRPIDRRLVEHWRTFGFTEDRVRLLRQDGRTVGCVHGEPLGEMWQVHLLALRPGISGEAGARLRADLCARAKAQGAQCVVGPNSRTMVHYGGYVLGNEPYHPHFATPVTDAYVRAGFHVSHPAVILVCDQSGSVLEPVPDGYEIVSVTPAAEFGAKTFGFHALQAGEKAAHCYARLYPELRDSHGRPVGQIGNVTTEAKHRNRGLARCMVRMSIKRLREMGAGDILIATGLENHPALRAYGKCGFERRHFIIEWSRKL